MAQIRASSDLVLCIEIDAVPQQLHRKHRRQQFNASPPLPVPRCPVCPPNPAASRTHPEKGQTPYRKANWVQALHAPRARGPAPAALRKVVVRMSGQDWERAFSALRSNQTFELSGRRRQDARARTEKCFAYRMSGLCGAPLAFRLSAAALALLGHIGGSRTQQTHEDLDRPVDGHRKRN